MILALAGCSGNPSGLGSNTTSPTSADTATNASASVSPIAAKRYTAEELFAVIPTVVDSTGTPYNRVPTELLNQSMAALKAQMAGMQVTPTECRELAVQNSNLPEGSILATGNSAADKSVLSALSAQDSTVLAKYRKEAESDIKTCGNFTVIAGARRSKSR